VSLLQPITAIRTLGPNRINRTPAPKHAPHQNTLKRVLPTTTKCAISTPNRFGLTRQWPQFKEGTLYTLTMLRITMSAAVLPSRGVSEVLLSQRSKRTHSGINVLPSSKKRF